MLMTLGEEDMLMEMYGDLYGISFIRLNRLRWIEHVSRIHFCIWYPTFLPTRKCIRCVILTLRERD